MRSSHLDYTRDIDSRGEADFGEYLALQSFDYSKPPAPAENGNSFPDPPVTWATGTRYCDQPMDWRTRLVGLTGTVSVIGMVLAAALFTWKTVQQITTSSQPLVVIELAPLATPSEPAREVAPGPEQVERQEAKPIPEPDVISPPPLIQLTSPNLTAKEKQEVPEVVDPGPRVPETTAPKSVAAAPANRLSNDVRPNWEGLILAHLERFRRYPARARAARQQGTAYIRFTMNRAGMVLSSAIVKKSGSFDLDRAALDTLQRAQPLPAIPESRPDIVELTIPVEFYLQR
ncbi:TonB family protein [Novosphingobium resinovorum]|uniref:TonB family protein n=1 Tax=Novosphingobium resinovorum TaxID=158500 RepID=UPI002ED29757|nr:TonB family protein [Novosphingobium resinovorum]